MNSFDRILRDWMKQRETLEKFELAFKDKNLWIQKREAIEQALMKLQEEMDLDFLAKRRKGKLDEEEILHIQESFEKKRGLMNRMKQELFQIDQWIDQSEDLTVQHLHQQRFQLLQALWMIYPENQDHQEEQWEILNRLRILEIEFQGFEIILNRLSEHLHIAIQTRRSIKGRGILNYIFGVSPNATIEKQLFGMHALLEGALPLLENMLSQKPPQDLVQYIQELQSWFEELKVSSRKSWSFRRLDVFFSETQPILDKNIARWKELHHQIKMQIESLNNEVQGWIEGI